MSLALATPKSAITPSGVTGRVGSFNSPWALSLEPEALLVVAGLPGAGKTHLLERLQPAAEVFSAESEVIRKHGPEPDWERVNFSRAIGAALEHADAALADGDPAILECVALYPALRAEARLVAARNERPAHLLWLSVTPETARQGQRERGRELPDEIWAHYRNLAAEYESLEHDPHAVITREGWDSVTIVDRDAADEIVEISFASTRSTR